MTSLSRVEVMKQQLPHFYEYTDIEMLDDVFELRGARDEVTTTPFVHTP